MTPTPPQAGERAEALDAGPATFVKLRSRLEYWEKYPITATGMTGCPVCGRWVTEGSGNVYLAKCGRFVVPDDDPIPMLCIVAGSDPDNETVQFVGRMINP